MAKITCAISGITFSCNHAPCTLQAVDGYFHPIFALPYKKLYGLYSKHCKGELTPTDSYLLFLSFLHSTEQITWKHPATCKPTDSSTISLIENNLGQLIRVVEATGIIRHPSFKQPSFTCTLDSSDLHSISNWIAAWQENIQDFTTGARDQRLYESLQKLENKLSYYLKSGLSPERYAFAVAAWADRAAEFPAPKRELWMKTIRTCYNSSKMFSTPLDRLREIKAYCEENIEAGSIHSFSLMQTLKEGISRHTDYLGMNPIALGYTLMPIDSSVNDAAVEAVKSKATLEAPSRLDYQSDGDFLRARLRYRVASITAITASKKER